MITLILVGVLVVVAFVVGVLFTRRNKKKIDIAADAVNKVGETFKK